MKAYIYEIISIIKPERIYIGSTVYIKKRFQGHLTNLKLKQHHSIKLQRHYNKYGKEDLSFSIIEEFDFISKEHLLEREQHFIDAKSPWFNINQNAASRLGSVNSEKHRKRISDSLKEFNIKNPDHQTGANNPMYKKQGWCKGLTKENSEVIRKAGEKQSKTKKELRLPSPNKGKKQKIIQCPFCHKEGGMLNMHRYHFDNCKHNPKNILN